MRDGNDCKFINFLSANLMTDFSMKKKTLDFLFGCKNE